MHIKHLFQSPQWSLYFYALSVNLVSISVGIAFAWTSPTIPILSSTLPSNPLSTPTTKNQESWLAALLSLGTALGPIAARFTSDRLGRKRTLMIFSLFIITSFITLAFSTNLELYLVARFALGIGCGCNFSVVPLYVGEIAENKTRGFLCCIMAILMSLGFWLAYIVGPYVSILAFSLFSAFPSLLFLVLFGVFAPESPYYLIHINKELRAKAALIKLRNKTKDDIEKELNEIKEYLEKSKAERGGFKELLSSKSGKKGLLICVGVIAVQQFAGMTVIFAYMQPILDATGSSIPGDISSIIIGFIQFVMNIVTSRLVDRLGRRPLLIASATGVSLSLGALGTYFYLKNIDYDVQSLFWLPTIILITYYCAFTSGLGPVSWAIVGEMFPMNLKSLCSTITTCSCFMFSFIAIVSSPNLTILLGMAELFWFFAGCSLCSVMFFAMVLPETKGKSFEDIQRLLNQ